MRRNTSNSNRGKSTLTNSVPLQVWMPSIDHKWPGEWESRLKRSSAPIWSGSLPQRWKWFLPFQLEGTSTLQLDLKRQSVWLYLLFCNYKKALKKPGHVFFFFFGWIRIWMQPCLGLRQTQVSIFEPIHTQLGQLVLMLSALSQKIYNPSGGKIIK